MEVEINRPMAGTSWLSFFEYLKSYIPRWGTTTNNTCQTAAVVGIGKRQISCAGNSSYRPGAPQVDSSYDASSDYGVFMVKKQATESTESLTVNQYLFDSRPAFLKVKPLTIAKNVYFSRKVRYPGDSVMTPFLAAGVVDGNNFRPQELVAKHFDSLVAQHVIKNEWLNLVIDMFNSLNNGKKMPSHILIDFRTEAIPGVAENVAMTTVSAPKTGEGPRHFDYSTAPACSEDKQPFIEFLNMLGIHGTPEEINMDEAKEAYRTFKNNEEMPHEFEAKINNYNMILQTMRTKMTRQFRRHAYNIETNVAVAETQHSIEKMNVVKDKMIAEAAITIIEGFITIKKDDVRATMRQNLEKNFPNCPSGLLEALLAGTINMYNPAINWPQNFELIDWCLITEGEEGEIMTTSENEEGKQTNKRSKEIVPKDPKDYMVYVETTIQDGERLLFTTLNQLVEEMIDSQSDPRIQSVRIGGKSKRNKSKRRNTKKRRNKKGQRKTLKQNKKRKSSQKKRF